MDYDSKYNIKDKLHKAKKVHQIGAFLLYFLGKTQFFTGIYLYNKINPEGPNQNYYVAPLIMQIIVLIFLKIVPEGTYFMKKSPNII
jgi:hypothetical protein